MQNSMRLNISTPYSRIILLLLTLHSSFRALCQPALGIESGISWSYMRIDTAQLATDEYVRYVTGFPLGVSMSFMLWEKWNFYTGLKFNPKGVQQKHYNQEYLEIHAGYLELPINIRFLTGNNNVHWYLETGISVLYLISYTLKFHEHDLLTDRWNDTTLVLDPIKVNKELQIENKPLLSLFDFQISAGTGMQVNIKNWILSTGFSFEWGLKNFFVIPESIKGFIPVLNRSIVINTGVHYKLNSKPQTPNPKGL